MYEQYSSEEEDGTSRSRSEGRRRSALSAEMAMANVGQAERKKSIDEEEKRAGGGGERERRKEEEEGRMRRREVTQGQRRGGERKEEGERRRKERKGEDGEGKEEEEERRRGRERRKEEEEKGIRAEEGGGRERKEEGRRSWSVGGEAAKQRQKLAREGEERMKEAELEEEMKGKEGEGTDERVGAKSNGKEAKSASGVPRPFSSAPVALPQSLSDHFSFACHLFPRLSESNLQFHDIYWDRDPDTKVPTLRKRHVCVTKLIRSITVRVLGPSADQLHHFRADLSLLDRRPSARRQIVSNIFSVPVPVVQGKLFRKVPSSASVLVRSNYRQPEVALQIVLQRVPVRAGPTVPVDTSKLAQTVGRVELDILDAGGQMALPSRTHSRTFDGTLRLDFEMADVPAREQLQADSLPDVLICDESWLPMLAIYRQLMCEQLARAGDVFADRSTWVLDPVMATFPRLLDTDRDAIDLLLALLHKFDADKRDLPPCECSRRFRFVFLHFILPLTALVDSSSWRQQLRAFAQKGSLAGAEPNPFKTFAMEPCKPIDTLEYALSLCGEHAID